MNDSKNDKNMLQRKYSMKDGILKGREWTAIVYPDSAPANWRDILDETHYRWIESPLHDKDVNPDGEVKKAHWHILLSADGPITEKTAKEVFKKLNTPEIRKVGSAKGLVRYMIHLDNPEKYQYDIQDIIGHNGADIDSYFELTPTSKLSVLKDMVIYIRDNQVDNFSDFVMTCIEKSDDWFNVAMNSNTLGLNKVIDAEWQKKQRGLSALK